MLKAETSSYQTKVWSEIGFSFILIGSQIYGVKHERDSTSADSDDAAVIKVHQIKVFVCKHFFLFFF